MFLGGCDNFNSSNTDESGNTDEDIVLFYNLVPIGYYEAEGEDDYGIELTEDNQILICWGGATLSIV